MGFELGAKGGWWTYTKPEALQAAERLELWLRVVAWLDWESGSPKSGFVPSHLQQSCFLLAPRVAKVPLTLAQQDVNL